MESWCLADYVALIDIQYSKKGQLQEQNDEEIQDPEQLEQHEQTDSYIDESTFPYHMQNGITLKLHSKKKIIWFVNYHLKSDPENYYREQLMLYVPWRKEHDILGQSTSYQEQFKNNETCIKAKMTEYEPMSSVLESATEELQQETIENNIVAPSTQHTDKNDGQTQPIIASEMAVFEPDNTNEQYHTDIGPELGIPTTDIEGFDINLKPNIMNDTAYFSLLNSLNTMHRISI